MTSFAQEKSSRYASDQAGRDFLKQLTRGFQTIEQSMVRDYVPPNEAATAAIELADEVFAALPMPDRLRGNEAVQKAMTDAHHAHLNLVRKYAENTYETAATARAYGERTRAMRRMEAALEAPEYTERFDTAKRTDDMVRASRMTFGDASAAPIGATAPWVRGDIAAAAANGEYDTLAALVADEYVSEVDALRGAAAEESSEEEEEEEEETVVAEEPRASTLVNLERTHKLGRFDVDPVASLERKEARDDARASVRKAVQRGLGAHGARPEFGNLVAAAERIRAHPLLLAKNPDCSDAVVNAAAQYFVQSAGRADSVALIRTDDRQFGEFDYGPVKRVVRSMSQTVDAVYQWVASFVTAQDSLLKRIAVHTNTLKAQKAAMESEVFEEAMRDQIMDNYTANAILQFRSEGGFFFFDTEEAEYLKLPYLEVIAQRHTVYQNWHVESTSNKADLHHRIVRDYKRLLRKVIEANIKYTDTASLTSTTVNMLKSKARVALRSMTPIGMEESAEATRGDVASGILTPVQAFAPDTNEVLTIDDPRVKDAIKRANMVLVEARKGNTTTLAGVTGVPGGAPESVLLNETRTLAVDAQFVNSTFVDVNDFLVDGELLTNDPDTDAPVQMPELQPTLIANSGYNTSYVWKLGFDGPLAPVDIELYMGSARVANGSKLARFPQLIRYARSVGVLFRSSKLGILTRSVGVMGESATPFYDMLVDAVDDDADARGMGTKASLESVLRDMVNYARAHTSAQDPVIPADELIEGDRMLAFVPPSGTELHSRALFVIDQYVALSQRENLQIAYTIGPVLSMLQVDQDMQAEVRSLDSIVIDAARNAPLNETARDAIRKQVETLQVKELQTLHRQLLHTLAVPAAQNFRRLRAGGDGAVLESSVLLMRRVDGRVLGEKFANTTLEMIYSVPKSGTVDEENMAARRILVRNTTPRQRAIVRIDASPSCGQSGLGTDSETCRILTITDTVARIDADTVSRVQMLDTVTRKTLTMRIIDRETNRPIRELLADVEFGADNATDPGQNEAVALYGESEREADARYGSAVRRNALAEIMTAFHSTDESGGEWWTARLMRLIRAALVSPVLDVSDVLSATLLNQNTSYDVLRAHSIAFASLEYLVTLFAIARTTGSFVVSVFARIGFVERLWRACRDALTSAVTSLRLHIVWNTIAGVMRWVIDMVRGDNDDEEKSERVRKEAAELLNSSDDGQPPSDGWWLQFDSFLEKTLPPKMAAFAKQIARLSRALTGIVTRMLGALVTALVGAVADSSYISIGVLGVLRVASLWVLLRTFPIWSSHLLVFTKVVAYRVITIGIMHLAINQSRRAVAALLSSVTSERRAESAARNLVLAGLLSVKIAPYIARRAYPAAALVTGAEELTSDWDQIHSTFPAVLGAAMPIHPGANIELTVFAARSFSNIAFTLLDLIVKRAVDFSGTLVSQRATINAVDAAFDRVALDAMVQRNAFGRTTIAVWRDMLYQTLVLLGTLGVRDRLGDLPQSNRMTNNFIAYISSARVLAAMDESLQDKLSEDGDGLDGGDDLFAFAFGKKHAAQTIEACAAGVDLKVLRDEEAARGELPE